MWRSRLRLVALGLVSACATILLPASAQATVTWSSNVYGATQQLSPTGQAASDVQVATDAAGDAVAVWLQNQGGTNTSANNGNNRVAVAYRPAGENFGSGSYISDDQGDAESLKVAMNASGEAIVTWNETVLEGEATTLPVGTDGMYALSSGGGVFGAATESASSVMDGTNSLVMNQTQVGIDSAGDAVIAYTPGQPAPSPYPAGSVVAQFRPAGAGSSFGAGEVLNANEMGQNSVVPTGLSLGMNGAGAAAATWDQVNGSDADGVEQVFGSYRAAGASTSDSSSPAGFSLADEVSSPDSDAPQPGPSTVELDASGDAEVIWDQYTPGTAQNAEIGVETAYRPATAEYYNLPEQVGSYTATVSDPETPFAGVGTPSVAFDGSGDAFAVWGGAASADPGDSDSAAHVADPLSVAYQPTLRGASVGGCRMWQYADEYLALNDALRLSRAMTFKSAVAGLPLGGGKSVIVIPEGEELTPRRRRDALLDIGDTIDVLGGRYVCAEDVGTSARDMAVIAQQTPYVAGLSRQKGGSGDPSPFTAVGVVNAIKASVARRFGDPSLAGRTISVVGAGHVGGRIATLCAKEGAKLILADVDKSKRELAVELGARWMTPAKAMTAKVDVLAPCALGGVLNEESVAQLRCQVIAGAANNQLAHEGVAGLLKLRGILWAPDFVANAGGIINVAQERIGPYDPKGANVAVAGIADTVTRIFDTAEADDITTLDAAMKLARAALEPSAVAAAARKRR